MKRGPNQIENPQNGGWSQRNVSIMPKYGSTHSEQSCKWHGQISVAILSLFHLVKCHWIELASTVGIVAGAGPRWFSHSASTLAICPWHEQYLTLPTWRSTKVPHSLNHELRAWPSQLNTVKQFNHII